MGTTLYARSNGGYESDYSTGTNTTKVNGSGSGWVSFELSPSRGSGSLSYTTSTEAGPTSGIECVQSTPPVEWISPPLAADVTISGSIIFNIWGLESSMSANVAINCRLDKIDGATGAITQIHKTVRTTELSTGTTANNWTETPTSTACKRGDRLRLTIFGDDSTSNMASGYTFNVYVGASSGGSLGDSYLTLNETVTFESSPTSTTVYLTDTASDVATAAVDRVAWTSRGGGVQTDVRNTATGWTAPLQMTDTAGGTVVDWWTPQLTAFTLGGAVKTNLRAAATNGASTFAVMRVEIAVCNSDGTNPVTWGVATFGDSIAASEGADLVVLVGGDDVSVTNGQRLRIRVMIDDASSSAMVGSETVTLYYAGTSGGGSGDSYLTFNTTLSEYSAGPATVTLGLIDASRAIYAPTLTPKNTVELGLIDASRAIYALTVVAGPALLTLPLIDAGRAIYAPTLTTSAIDVSLGLIDASRAIYAPTLTLAAYPISLGLIDAGRAIYALTVSAIQTVGLPLIVSAFTDGFETGTTDLWSTVFATNGAIAVQAGSAHDGSYGLHIDEAANAAGGVYVRRTFAATDIVHASGWFRAVTDGAAGNNNANLRIFSGGTRIVDVYRQNSTKEMWLRFLDDTSTMRYRPTAGWSTRADNTWYHWDVRVEYAGASSRVVAKLDGVVYVDETVSLKQGAFDMLQLGAEHPNQYVDLDADTIVLDPYGPQTFAPTLAPKNTISLGLIDSGSAIYAPTLTLAPYPITLGLIDASRAIYALTLSSTVALPLIDSGSAIYAPTLTLAPYPVALPLIDAGSAIYDLTLAHAGGATQGITLGLLDAGSAIYAPTLILAPYPVTLPLIDSGSAIYVPTITLAPYPITLGLIDASRAIYAPTLVATNTVTLGLIDAGRAIYALTVIADQFIDLGLIDAGSAIYAPTITTGFKIELGLIDSGSAIYAPTLTVGPVSVTLPLIDASSAIYALTLVGKNAVALPLTDAGSAIYALSLSTVNTVQLGLIDSVATIYAPTLTQTGASLQTVTLDLIDAGSAVYAPTLVPGPVGVTLPLLDASRAIYEPTLTTGYTITLGLLDAGPAIYEPTLGLAAYPISLGLIDAGSEIYAPTITGINLIDLGIIDAGSAIYNLTLSGQLTVALPLITSTSAAFEVAIQRGPPPGWTFRLHEPAYHLIVYSPGGTGGPGTAKLDLTSDLLNVVWQAGLNLPEMCAFTLARENPKIAQIAWMVDHFKLFREDASGLTTIMAGKLVKPQWSTTDVVVMGWDYKAFLQLSRTGYETMYPNKKLGTEIVSPEWTLAKTTADSPLEFVATGMIENPVGLNGTTEITTNEDFGLTMFNRLWTFFQIAEMGMANTANTVVFEITRTTPHTFNFWKNKGISSGHVLTAPGNLIEFSYDPAYEAIRNDRATIITDDATAGDPVTPYVVTDATSISTYRRLQDSLTVRTLMGLNSSATEADQQKEAMARLLKEGTRLPKVVTMWPRQGLVAPFRDIQLADTVRARLRDDATGALFDGTLRIIQLAGAWTPSEGEVLQIAGRGVD